MDSRAWRTIVHGVAKSQTQLKSLACMKHIHIYVCMSMFFFQILFHCRLL